jgi:hypothetical protein
MSARCLFAALALLGCLFGPARVEAQLPATGLSLTAEGVDTEFPGNPIYINVDACDDTPTTLKFTATLETTGAARQVQVVEVWGGAGKGSNCDSVEARKGDNNTQSKCWLVWRSSSVIMTGTSFTADFSADLAFDNNERDKKCDTGVTGSTYELYFVPLETQTTPGTGDAPAPLADVKGLSATFTLYTALPAAPGGVSGRDGEDEIGASWDTVNAGPTTRYTVYFDIGTGGSAGGGDAGAEALECGSGKLVAGETPPPVDDKTVFSASANSTSGSLTGLEAKGIGIGEQVAVAVATVDIAGNRSVLSSPVCVTRVETTGFWDACESSSCKDDFETCSVRPGKGPRGLFMTLGLAAGVLALGRRRKTRRERNV